MVSDNRDTRMTEAVTATIGAKIVGVRISIGMASLAGPCTLRNSASR
ncbi:MAG: hypothetical protein ACXVIS_03235 [Halobacteriota archaeon]